MDYKFKKGDRCIVIKNFLRPKCIGQEVIITGVFDTKSQTPIYSCKIPDTVIQGIASENCLTLKK